MAFPPYYPPVDYRCHECGDGDWMSVYTNVRITECPIHGKKAIQRRRLQSLTRRLQRGVYGSPVARQQETT